MTPREAVLEAVATFAAATDARDWEALRTMLTDDAGAYGERGADRVVATMRAHLGGVGPTQHLLGNHRVDRPDEDTARVLSYGRVHHVGAGPSAGDFYECLGEYDDTWVRREGRWLLARRWFDIRISLGDFSVLRPGP